jgi:anti-sigma regulatory factor (Ser/Thr protein kinase)
MSSALQVVLRPDAEAAGIARRAIAENHRTLPQSLRDDLSLLVTELVTNAVRHGGQADGRRLQIEFRQGGDQIRVEVTDPGSYFEAPSAPANGDSSGGWGLFLVDQIAQRWGVSSAPAGTCVWFELPAGIAA